MNELLPKKRDGHYEHIWRCDCMDSHFVTLSWDDEDPQFRYLSLVDAWQGRRLGERIKGAWKILRGRYHTGAEVLLTDEAVAGVRAVLSKHAKAEA